MQFLRACNESLLRKRYRQSGFRITGFVWTERKTLFIVESLTTHGVLTQGQYYQVTDRCIDTTFTIKYFLAKVTTFSLCQMSFINNNNVNKIKHMC